MTKLQLDYLAREAARGRIDRRTFLGRAGALGLSATAASALLGSVVQAQGAKKGGTIRVGLQGGSTSATLDPALATNSTDQQVMRLWGEQLVELTPDGGLEGKLAEEWSGNDDASSWTFKIRSGVEFSNGKTVTAEDVLATIERHAGDGSKSGALGLLKGIKSMKAEGDKFTVELDGPNADLPYAMSVIYLQIQPNGGKDDPNAAIGTGPYVLKDHDMGVSFSYDRNPNYWDSDVGNASQIELLVVNDDSARVAALQSNQVDMVNRVPPKVVSLVKRLPGVEIHSEPSKGHYIFIMHCNTAPFDNNDLRMALKYSINRQEMVDKILFGNGSIGNDTPINESYPLFEGFEQREYDPEKAASYYKKSGHSGSILLRTSENSFSGAPDAAQLFQASAKQAGIELEIKREPNDGYWSDVWNVQPFCTSYWGGRPTQDAMLSTAYLSTADWNDTRFFNVDFDKELIAARAEKDDAKRRQMYHDLSGMIRDTGGLICPMFNNFIDATSSRVAGWAPSKGFELMNFYAPIKMWVV
ncbi:ABC transporter substrate-binding protein [Seohaeicola zhoushanensis]|uniref:Peptide ABC transporter substrate-binding protein n=1 Tax=Seohaeicola zhoushanensis TaxID=1569283 RepID=A0A8J3GV11_9RHOB|nr:ABC transporter substrate-binding protein [Seohaeicola zhoushanensis]GHF39232.1 peptide ABC transporter substrate-binding protein [Seohaeicola zhoushanensis]